MRLGKSELETAQIGLGCWAIGGQFYDMGVEGGWGDVDDRVSMEALECGLAEGAGFFDTANIYGAGHSEELVGRLAKSHRNEMIICTKFGILCDEEKKTTTGEIQNSADIIKSCEDSLRRLGTDTIDLFLFHLGTYDPEKAYAVRDTLEELVRAGKIRYFGWSTPDPARAAVFAGSPYCIGMEFAENVMEDDPAMRGFCKEKGLAAICRSPLAMGLLTGKYRSGTVLPDNDLRGRHAPAWMTYYVDGKPNETMLKKLEAIREILTSGGRTLAQGCINYIQGCGEHCMPIPGFKTPKQVRENVGALRFGPLSAKQTGEIERILSGAEK